ncbi:MAG: IPT/TIG domain-containing protein [Cytophagales bacterium]
MKTIKSLSVYSVLVAVLFACNKKNDPLPSTPAPTIASFIPTTAAAGATIPLTGTNFTGTTAVSFGGIPATSFTVVSATSITAVVGAGASGNVSVTTLGGTVSLSGFTFNSDPALKLTVDFNTGSYTPLTYTTGRTDSPADADAAYSAIISSNQIVYNVPTSTLRPKLSGFLDLPQSATYAPISGNMIHEFTFTDVSQLNALGADANSLAIAACYIRGNYSTANGKDWTTGDNFGGYWFGFVKNVDGTKQTVIRSANTNLVFETFSATTSVSYRVYKKGNVIELYRKYDAATTWTKVGETTLTIRAGGSSDVYITHVRVLNNSNAAVAVNADDFKWYY